MTDETSSVVAFFLKRTARVRTILNKLGPNWALILVLLLGFGLRVYRLGDQNIWWDEGHAVWAARQSLDQVTDITAHDVHPPLYLWMLHGWLRLAGDSEFSVRTLSTIGGMLSVALAYVVARRLVGQRAALLATLLVATSRFHIWWSQEARMYIWATWFVLLSVYYMIRLRHGGLVGWWLYILTSAAALYTLYLSVLVLVVGNVFTALTVWHKPQRRRFLFNWGLAQLGILVLYMPWLYIALDRIRTDTAKTPFSLRLVWQLYGTVLATGISTHLDRYVGLLGFFGLLTIVGVLILALDRDQPQRHGFAGWEIGLLLVLPLVVPPLVVFGLSVPRGIYYSPKPEARYLVMFAPLFYILLAGALTALWQKRRGRRPIWGVVAIIATVVVLGTFAGVLPEYYAGRYLRDEYQSALLALDAYAEPGDAVLVVSGDRYPLFLYYYARQFPNEDGPPVYLLPRHSTQFSADTVERELAPLAEQHPRLWLASFDRTLQDPENVVESWLDAHRTSVLYVAQGYNAMRLYAREDDVPSEVSPAFQPQYRVNCQWGDSVLVGYDLPTHEFRPGDHVGLALYVRLAAERVAPARFAVDWMAPNGQIVERREIAVPALVPGERTVRLMAPFAVFKYTIPGRYTVDVYPAGAAPASETLVAQGSERARLHVGQVTHSLRLPRRKISRRQEVSLGEGLIQFLGSGVRPEEQVRPGGQVTVDLFWQAARRPDRAYTVFVHVLGGYNPATGGPVWAQDDSEPLEGGHPTTRWVPGQIVADRHVLVLPAEMPPGTFSIEVGLYDALTGARLSVAESDQDRILIGEIQVIQ